MTRATTTAVVAAATVRHRGDRVPGSDSPFFFFFFPLLRAAPGPGSGGGNRVIVNRLHARARFLFYCYFFFTSLRHARGFFLFTSRFNVAAIPSSTQKRDTRAHSIGRRSVPRGTHPPPRTRVNPLSSPSACVAPRVTITRVRGSRSGARTGFRADRLFHAHYHSLLILQSLTFVARDDPSE